MGLTVAPMVSYGYGPSVPKWNENKKDDLALSLQHLLIAMEKEGKFKGIQGEISPMQGEVELREGGKKPYIEVDGLYPGVEIRKLTHLKGEVLEELVNRANKIYKEIMSSL